MQPHADGMTGEIREMRERRRPPNDHNIAETALKNQGGFVLQSNARSFNRSKKLKIFSKNFKKALAFVATDVIIYIVRGKPITITGQDGKGETNGRSYD